MTSNITGLLGELTQYNPAVDLDLTAYNKLRDKLADCINDLIAKDFTAFVHLLYTIDISESKIKELISSDTNHPATTAITQLIIDRQLQKAKVRNSFSETKADNIPDEDKW